jgi:hypothetical protein
VYVIDPEKFPDDKILREKLQLDKLVFINLLIFKIIFKLIYLFIFIFIE